jgi:hypothetical protein
MGAGIKNFFRLCLIWLSGSHRRGSRAEVVLRLLSLLLSHSLLRSSSTYVNLSPVASATLLALIRELFKACEIAPHGILLSSAQWSIACSMVDRRRRVIKAPRCSSGPTRRLALLIPKPRGLSELMS